MYNRPAPRAINTAVIENFIVHYSLYKQVSPILFIKKKAKNM